MSIVKIRRFICESRHLGRMRWKLALILICFLTSAALCAGAQAVEKNLPFREGEKLTYLVTWTVIPAGEFVLEVLPHETLNGSPSRHFQLTARTYPFIDIFYKVRDRIDAYTDREMTHSILYKKKQEGKSRRDVVVEFNWEKQEAQYSNFGEKRAPIPLMPGAFDPLSIFYAFRLRELSENLELEQPVTDGKKSVLGRARVIKREKVEVAAGSFDTYLVEPDLKHIGGVFRKSKDAKLEIWVTADSLRIPVKIKSKVSVGSFVGELISVEYSEAYRNKGKQGPSAPWWKE